MITLIEIALSNALVAALLALAVMAIGRVCRRPAVMHCLWVLVLVKLVTPPIFSVPIEVDLPQTPTEQLAADIVEPLVAPAHPDPSPQQLVDSHPNSYDLDFEEHEPIDLALDLQADRLPPLPAERENVDEMIEPESDALITEPVEAVVITAEPVEVATAALAPSNRADDPTPPAAAATEAPLDLGQIVQWSLRLMFVIWATGTLLLVAYNVIRILRFWRGLQQAVDAPDWLAQEVKRLSQRIGIRRAPRVMLVRQPVSPMLWAAFGRPQLIFPAELLDRLDRRGTSTLLLHELAHMRRGDHWIRRLELLVVCLYWWNPIAWWACRQVQIVGEECCDAWVVANARYGSKVYASAIVSTLDFLSEAGTALPVGASGIGQVEFLRKRLTLIMRGGVAGRLTGFSRLAMLAVSALALSFFPYLIDTPAVTTWAAEEEVDEPSEEAETNQPAAAPEDFVTPNMPEPADFETQPRNLQSTGDNTSCVAYSKDGKWLASSHGGTTRGTVRLWNLQDNSEQFTLEESIGAACVAFSPDGKSLAYTRYDGAVKVIEVTSKRELLNFSIGMGGAAKVAFSADGESLVTAAGVTTGGDGRRQGGVTIWSTETGKLVSQLEGDAFRYQDLRFSPDGRLLAVGGGTMQGERMGQIDVWDFESRKRIHALKGHTQTVLSIAFSPDSKRLVSSSVDRSFRFWNVERGILESTVAKDAREIGRTIAFSPEGNTLAVGSWDNSIKLWNADGTVQVGTLGGHTDMIRSVAFSPDGATLASGGNNEPIKLWDVAARRQRSALGSSSGRVDPQQPVLAIAHSPDGTLLASAHEDKSVRLRNPTDGSLLREIEGHDDVVASLAFSPDSTVLATASFDNTIKLWNPASGQLLRTLKGHDNWVISVSFSPDGKRLVSGGYDKTIRLWNPVDGTEVAKFTAHTASVRSVAFTPDGKQIVSGSSDRTARLWDVESKKEIHKFSGHTGAIRAVAASPDGQFLATASEDGTIKTWSIESGKEVSNLTGHQGMVWCLAYSPRGRTLASGGFDNTVRIWDPTTGTSVQSLRGHRDVVASLSYAPDSLSLVTGSYDATLNRWQANAPRIPAALTIITSAGEAACRTVVFSKDGKLMITGGHDPVLHAWDMMTGQLVQTFEGHNRGTTCATISPDGSLLATGAFSDAIALWDIKTGKRVAEFRTGDKQSNSINFSPDGRRLVVGGWGMTVSVWDVKSRQRIWESPQQALPITSAVFSPDGETIATSSGNWRKGNEPGEAKLWNANDGRELANLPGHTAQVKRLCFSVDGRRLATSCGDKQVRVFDTETHELVRSISTPLSVECLTYLPDNTSLAVAHYGGRVALWNSDNGRNLAEYEGHSKSIFHITHTVDGSLIATAGADGTVRLWPTTLPTAPTIFRAAGAWVVGVAFTPDGKQILTSRGPENSLQLRDRETGREIRRFVGHSKPAMPVAISLDGKRVLSGSSDKTIRLWDLQTGRQILQMDGHTEEVRGVEFSPDGKLALSAGNDYTARLWDTATGKQLHELKVSQRTVCQAVFSPNGEFALVPDGKKCAVWDVNTGDVLRHFEGHSSGIICPAISPDGKLALTGDYDANLLLWDVESGQLVRSFKGHTDRVRSVAFSPDGKSAVSGSYDKSIIVWNVATGRMVNRLQGHRSLILRLAYSPDGQSILSGGGDRTARLWKLGNNKTTTAARRVAAWSNSGLKPVFPLVSTRRVQQQQTLFGAVSPDRKWLAAGGQDGTIQLIDTSAENSQQPLSGHDGKVWAGQFSPDGKLFASAGEDFSVRLWNVATGRQAGLLNEHKNRVLAVVFSPDGKNLFSAASGGKIVKWDVAERKLVAIYRKPNTSILALAMSPDGKTLAAGGWSKQINLWDTSVDRATGTLKGHTDRVMSLAFSPDGKLLVSGALGLDQEQAVKVWDVAGRREHYQISEKSRLVGAASFAPDGKTFVTSSSDRTIRLWNAVDGRLLGTQHTGHEINIRSLVHSSDGKRLISTDMAGNIKQWDLAAKKDRLAKADK